MWQDDQSCHRPFYQGPCDKGQILIDHPQGPICEFKNLGDVERKVSCFVFEKNIFYQKNLCDFIYGTSFKYTQKARRINALY